MFNFIKISTDIGGYRSPYRKRLLFGKSSRTIAFLIGAVFLFYFTPGSGVGSGFIVGVDVVVPNGDITPSPLLYTSSSLSLQSTLVKNTLDYKSPIEL